MNRIKQYRARKGIATVEFAFVAPILFLVVFGLLEMSRMYIIKGTVTTALLTGGREASISSSNHNSIRNEIVSVLSKTGIQQFDLSVNPQRINRATEEVTIRIDVPMSAKNGFVFTNFLSGKSMTRVITRKRD